MANNRKILFLGKLQSNIIDECDACREHKLLEYLAMDEKNNMFTVCKECSEHFKNIINPA